MTNEVTTPLTITIHRDSNGDVSLHAPDADNYMEVTDLLAHVHETILREQSRLYAGQLIEAVRA